MLEKIIPIKVDYDAYNLGLVREQINRIHTEVEVMLGVLTQYSYQFLYEVVNPYVVPTIRIL